MTLFLKPKVTVSLYQNPEDLGMVQVLTLISSWLLLGKGLISLEPLSTTNINYWILWLYHKPGTVPSTWYTFLHLVLTKILCRSYLSHILTDKENEAQRKQVTCLRLPRYWAAKQKWELGCLLPNSTIPNLCTILLPSQDCYES